MYQPETEKTKETKIKIVPDKARANQAELRKILTEKERGETDLCCLYQEPELSIDKKLSACIFGAL